jgi:hypothetical protein
LLAAEEILGALRSWDSEIVVDDACKHDVQVPRIKMTTVSMCADQI